MKLRSIEYVGATEQQCIRVSSKDKLYITNDNISTLNSVVSGVLSELAFFRESGKNDDYIMRIYNDTKSRVDSRMKGNYWGRTILDSSPNTLESPIDDYIVNEAHKDPSNFIIQGSVWKWAPEEYDMSRTFQVYTGGKGQPPRILDPSEDTSEMPLTKLVEVPSQLYQFFKDDLYKALKDRAGIPAGSADSLIYDYSKIEGVFSEKLKNVYTHLTASIEEEARDLLWNQIKTQFFVRKAGRMEFYYKPHLPRVFSVDQSLTQDVSAIAVGHVERIPEKEDLMYVIDFTIPVAPQGSRISLDAIKYFIEDLRDKGGMYLTHGSFDQFQSESSIQYLNSKGFEVEKLSVDLTTDPYFHLLGLMETGRIISGRNIYFKNNLKSIKIVKNKRSGKPKVDHDNSQQVITVGDAKWETSRIGYYAKDVTDSVAAVCELLRKYHPVAYEAWDLNYLDVIFDPEAKKKDIEAKLSTFFEKQSMLV